MNDQCVEGRHESSSDPRSLAKRPKNRAEALGQVSTPTSVAEVMADRLLLMINGPEILDPCVGMYTFPKALLERSGGLRGYNLAVIDIDGEMISATRRWADGKSVEVRESCGDYLLMELDQAYDGVILNPPFIRQEWIKEKARYRKVFNERYGLSIPGTSNLYVYFMVKAIQDLRPGGAISAVIYDSWRSTRYGKWLRDYLSDQCEELEVAAASRTPFEGHLIDATIITGRRSYSKAGLARQAHEVDEGSHFSGIEGFTLLSQAFRTARGLRLKQADFFLVDRETGNRVGATPFLKKVSKIHGYAIPDDHDEAALLVESADQNPTAYETLLERLERARSNPEKNVSILTWYNERPHSWYKHRKAPYSPIVFNYYLRNRPRHIHNPRLPYSDNFYGLDSVCDEPVPVCLAILNSTAVCTEVLSRARNQGSGLRKLQLFEYRNLVVPNPSFVPGDEKRRLGALGKRLVEEPDSSREVIRQIDETLYRIFRDDRLRPDNVLRLYHRYSEKG